MSTVAIYNGFGGYETKDGKQGVTLTHGGVPFWFPYEGVCYIPDYTMREVDHDKSSADKEEESVLTYKTFILKGERIAEELLETQIPHPNSAKGFAIVIPSAADRQAQKYITIPSGYTEEGSALTTDVMAVTPSDNVKAVAKQKADEYKTEIVRAYYQSKRERMSGGHGQLFPIGSVKRFMDELGLKDIDDVAVKNAAGGSDLAELIKLLVPALQGGSKPTEQPDLTPMIAELQKQLSDQKTEHKTAQAVREKEVAMLEKQLEEAKKLLAPPKPQIRPPATP